MVAELAEIYLIEQSYLGDMSGQPLFPTSSSPFFVPLYYCFSHLPFSVEHNSQVARDNAGPTRRCLLLRNVNDQPI